MVICPALLPPENFCASGSNHKRGRQSGEQPAQCPAHFHELLDALGVETRLARIADVLLALEAVIIPCIELVRTAEPGSTTTGS
jgi:hypothetical protein